MPERHPHETTDPSGRPPTKMTADEIEQMMGNAEEYAEQEIARSEKYAANPKPRPKAWDQRLPSPTTNYRKRLTPNETEIVSAYVIRNIVNDLEEYRRIDEGTNAIRWAPDSIIGNLPTQVREAIGGDPVFIDTEGDLWVVDHQTRDWRPANPNLFYGHPQPIKPL